RRSCVEVKTRRPRHCVDQRVADMREVPVDDQHPVAPEARIVAAEVEMHERVATQLTLRRRTRQRRERCCKPLVVADSGTEKRLRIGCYGRPTVELRPDLLQ